LLEGVEEVKSVQRSSLVDPPSQTQAAAAPPPVFWPAQSPARQQFMVQIPAGVQGGAVMTMRAPDGRLVQVRVPPGAAPGTTIQVTV